MKENGLDVSFAGGVPSPLAAYGSCLRLRLMQGLQYRVAAIAGLTTQFFWGVMLILILEAYTRNADTALPMTLPQMASYIWLQQAFLVFVALWHRDGELFEMITSGNVAYELCRPTDLYVFWYARLMANRMAGAALRCLPVLAVALVLPQPYRLILPSDPQTFLVFLVALFLGLLVNVAISMFIYIFTFITLSHVGSLMLIGTLGEFASGMILPIPLMPEWLQRVVGFLPFRMAADFPFRVWSGHIGIQEALCGIGLQLAWLIFLSVTGWFAMKAVLRHVTLQGG